MVTLRRLYLYAMSAVTLGLLAAGLRTLLAVLFEVVEIGRAHV